ncbi:MAG TPA: hypothetical protein DDY70_04455 [Clostridiales bacterium]|nr:hypothetical protein [Clostridiales bacterium]
MKKQRFLSLFLLLVLLVTALTALSACGEKEYTVTFVGEGITLPAQQTVKESACATEPAEPVREGYTFLGWYVEGIDTPYDFDLPVVANLILTAKFEKTAPAVTYIVTFTGDGVDVPAQTVAEGGKATVPPVPTKEGYTFLGWYLEGAETPFDFNTPVTGDITLTARFEARSTGFFTVTFTGESVNIPSQTVAAGGTAMRPKSPSRDGYTFVGWFLEGSDTAYDFSTPITADITLVARYDALPFEDGTPEHPFLIRTPEEFIAFVEKINAPTEEGNEGYRTACYRLEADLDMTGKSWTPAGKTVTLTDEDSGEVTTTLNGFSGTFDGNGHTIRNLTITRTLRTGVATVGLFGVAEKAYFHDFTLENIDYSAESYTSNDNVGVAIGGVLGQGNLCTFRNIRVTGTIAPALCAENPAYIGGIVGYHQSAAYGDQSYISYIQNCSVELEVKNGSFDDGETGDMSGAVTGGIAGYISTYKCATAVVNCTVDGRITAGRYTGGVLGYLSGSYVSVINCANYASVTSTSPAKDVTYTGGIIAFSTGDNTLMDCYSTGRIKGVRSGSTQYKSYAGGIAGFAYTDDYESYYSAGLAVVNCYYTDNITTYDVKTSLGTAKTRDFTFDAAFARDTLHWDLSEMVFDGDNIATPAPASTASKTFHLILKDGDTLTPIDKIAENGFFATIGDVAGLKNRDGKLFFDWEHEGGARYRFYVPVVKDITLTARFEDSSLIAGVYTGIYSYGGDKDAGTIVLGNDGTLEWTVGSTIRGKYTWDGTNVIFEFYNNYGEVCALYNSGTLTFEIDAGMTGSIPYTMTKSNIRFVGGYYSPDGDSISFSGTNGFTFRSEDVRGNAEIKGTYTADGDTLTFSGLTDYYTRAEATVNPDGTLSLYFVANGSAGKTLDHVTFTRLSTPDYTGKGFLGTYNMPYLAYYSSDAPSQTDYTIVFEADGTVRYISKYSETLGFYYVFKNDSYIVMSLEGYTSIFHYDGTAGVIYGVLSRGTSSRHNVILTPQADGAQRIFVIDNDRTAVVVTDRKVYYIRSDEFILDCELTPAQFTDGGRITLDGADYRVIYYPADEDTKKTEGYGLTAIGAEEGTYTFGNITITLDGIGNVTGGKTGTYRTLADGKVVVLFDDDTILGFAYADAKAAENVITPLVPDQYQGVYYLGKDLTDDEGNTTTDDKYYKLIFDGFGTTALLYHVDGEYRHNWGSSSGWVAYTENGYGVHAEYNQYQKLDYLFYYNYQVVYTKSFGNLGGERSFAKAGYTGPTTPPTLPAGLEGKYTGTLSDGTSVVFNFKSDLTGTWRGTPFAAVYDGTDYVCFTIGSTLYRFNIETKVLTFGSETVTLTASGEITDVLPAGVCGTWSGTFDGMNSGTRTVKIEANGTIVYNGTVTFTDASYDVENKRITAAVETDAGKLCEITLTWDPATGSLSAEYKETTDDTDAVTLRCSSLTLQNA